MKSSTPRVAGGGSPNAAGPPFAPALCGLLLAAAAVAQAPAWEPGAERPSRALVPLPKNLVVEAATWCSGSGCGPTR